MTVIQLPKYTTIEVKEFPLNPDYSGDALNEYHEFCAARRKRDQNVYEYCVNKLGKNKVIRDYPTRMTVVIDGVRTYYHIESAHYSRLETHCPHRKRYAVKQRYATRQKDCVPRNGKGNAPSQPKRVLHRRSKTLPRKPQ